MTTHHTPRAGRRAQTRAWLLACARQTVAARGFQALRTAELATRAGVAHGSVFVHFPSRDDLSAAVADAIARDVAQALTALDRARPADPADALHRQALVLGAHAAEYRALLLDAAAGSPVTAHLWRDVDHAALAYATACLDASGIADAPRMARAWLALVHDALLRTARDRDMDAALAGLAAFFCDRLR